MRVVKLIVAVGLLAGVGVLAYEQRETRREVARLAARLDAPATPEALPTPSPAVAAGLPGDYVLEAPDVVEVCIADPAAVHLGGDKLVRPDGTISLGEMGNVAVAGLTLAQAQKGVARQLGMLGVTLSLKAGHSKFYYVVSDRTGGEQVARVSCTGNETVLDAVAAKVPTAGRVNVWVVRRQPNGEDQILPVDYRGITQRGDTATNYQIVSGDRVYVKNAD